MIRKTCTKNLFRNLNSAFALPFSLLKTLSTSTSASWQSTSHSVGGLDVEIGRLNPAYDESAQPARGTPDVSSVLAVHASGCSYKQWGKLRALLSCPLVAPNLYGYGRSQSWPADRTPDMTGGRHTFISLIWELNHPRLCFTRFCGLAGLCWRCTTCSPSGLLFYHNYPSS